MFSLKGAERILAGNHSFQISPYDPDYRGCHLIIWMAATGGGCCTGSHYGYLVQEKVDQELELWGCHKVDVPKLDGESPNCMSYLTVVRFSPARGPADPTHASVYKRIIAAYKTAIHEQDQRSR